MELHKKIVLLVGATGGIGESIALKLADEGCKLSLLGRREDKLKELCNKIIKNNKECIYRKCNISNIKEVKNSIEVTYKSFGRIDIALLTAGILAPNPIETFNSKIVINSIKINFLGNVYFIEHLLPIMKSQKSGTIAVTSTLCDHRGIYGWAGAYGSSKAALSWLLDSLRVEAKQKYNINIITIKPGSVSTPMVKIDGYQEPKGINPDQAAKIIIEGIKKEKKIIQFPLSLVLMVRLIDSFPVYIQDIISMLDY
jgi:NADP-dependent 3-hydroxy acid dehydrogenase YdfG